MRCRSPRSRATIADFGKRAQDGKLTVEELTGGTYTISNGGVFGSMLSTPIINPPQSAILGVHATKERAVVENGQVVVRPMNYLAQSYDHRIIDGREAVLSLVAIKEALEDPARCCWISEMLAQCCWNSDAVRDARSASTSSSSAPVPAGTSPPSAARSSASAPPASTTGPAPDGKPAPGGTCTNVGCIPSKALLQSSEHFDHAGHAFADHGIEIEGLAIDVAKMLARKDKVVAQNNDGILFLFKKNKVAFFHGRGSFAGGERRGRMEHRGRRPEAGRARGDARDRRDRLGAASAAGVPFDNVRVLDNAGALAFTEVPKRLGVVGAGVIGLEMGSVWRRLGAQTYGPRSAADVPGRGGRGGGEGGEAVFAKQGLVIHTGVEDHRRRRDERRGRRPLRRRRRQGAAGELRSLIVAIGRLPHTAGLDAAAVGLNLDERGFVAVDGECRTNLPNVWAIGDVVRGPMLAHKAEEEGVAVAERIAGQHGHVDFNTVPWVIYTSPEIAWVGKTEQELKAGAVAYRAGTFPFAANGRARALGDTTGFVKILADARPTAFSACTSSDPTLRS